MKTKIFLSIPLLLVLAAGALAQATPERAAQDFYRWYITELNADRYPIQRQKTAVRPKVSARLGKWLYSKAYEEYGADYFLDAQDWDPKWAKTATAKKNSQKGNTATVTLDFGPSEFMNGHKVRVTMLKEGGTWKIDRVAGMR